jgi:hypothetical protein
MECGDHSRLKEIAHRFPPLEIITGYLLLLTMDLEMPPGSSTDLLGNLLFEKSHALPPFYQDLLPAAPFFCAEP